ncbi:MAG: response regulator transcription factor [Hyphomicrobiaceae bacterium]|nr:MAG: response regulator transcription factor [Hyphomicrobiaceae bacterium]
MRSPGQVLMADHDEECRNLLGEQLAVSELQVVTVGTASQAIDAIKNRHFDIVLLDVDLPDLDGREACRILRKSGFHLPTIIVSASCADADIILALEAGANDFISKPLRLGVLLARMRVLLRQRAKSDDAVFAVGPYRFKPAAQTLVDTGGSKIRLTKKEAFLLRYLCMSETVVTREALLQEVWGYSPNASTHTVETHVYRLRQKIERNASRERLLLTEDGGYRLVQ